MGTKSYNSTIVQNKDEYYSIYQTYAGVFKIGNSEIEIDDENIIHIGEKSYSYTSEFWNLVMLNKPDNYIEEDLTRYIELVKLVDLINNPHQFGQKGNPKGSLK